MPNDINSAPPVADAPAVDAPSPDMPIAPVPEAALALHLLDQARQAGAAPVLAILRSAPRLDRVAALAGAMACTAEGAVVVF